MKLINVTMFLLFILFVINGCDPNNESPSNDLFQFQGSYVGDNSAIGNLAYKLPNGENLDGFELKTKEKPYGIVLNYKNIEVADLEKEYQEIAIYNASFIFALVQNADWITFNFDDHEYTITKQNLQNWYDKRLSEYKNEQELRRLIQDYLEDENKVKLLFGGNQANQ